MPTTKTALKTAAEKTAPAKKQTHGLTTEKLMDIHRKQRQPGWSWATGSEIKERYSISGHTLALLHRTYNLPQLVADQHGKPAYSLPALEHVLETVPEMLNTSIDDTNRCRLQQLQAEAEAEVKEKLRNEFEAKLSQ